MPFLGSVAIVGFMLACFVSPVAQAEPLSADGGIERAPPEQTQPRYSLLIAGSTLLALSFGVPFARAALGEAAGATFPLIVGKDEGGGHVILSSDLLWWGVPFVGPIAFERTQGNAHLLVAEAYTAAQLAGAGLVVASFIFPERADGPATGTSSRELLLSAGIGSFIVGYALLPAWDPTQDSRGWSIPFVSAARNPSLNASVLAFVEGMQAAGVALVLSSFFVDDAPRIEQKLSVLPYASPLGGGLTIAGTF
jgi:hypothetical protein